MVVVAGISLCADGVGMGVATVQEIIGNLSKV